MFVVIDIASTLSSAPLFRSFESKEEAAKEAERIMIKWPERIAWVVEGQVFQGVFSNR